MPSLGPHARVEGSLASAMCSSHPEVEARGTCGRCGDFLCAGCVAVEAGGVLICEACRPHVRSIAPLPWDQAPGPLSFLRTVRRILLAPRMTFAGMAPEPTRTAILFAMVWWVLPPAVSFVLGFAGVAARGGSYLASVCCALTCAPLLEAVLVTGVVSGITHVTARLLGGAGRYTTDFRTAAYATPFYAAYAAVSNVLPPSLGLLAGPVLLFVVGWVAWLVVQSVTAHHRLEPARAWVAGLSPVVLCVGGFVAFYVLVSP